MTPEKRFDIDFVSIETRLATLFSVESKYDKQKTQLEGQLSQFLASFPSPKSLTSTTPQDLCKFLVWKDSFGKTQVHILGCPHQGLKGMFDCGCPFRLAAGTVDSLIGKLRSIFKGKGMCDDWQEKFGFGNPAASLLVKRYLKLVKEEQAIASITPKQDTPMFVDKLARLSDHLDSKIDNARKNPTLLFILARDQAYFKTLLFSGDRPGDLTQVKTNEILRFPNDDGLLFNHTWGKTLRGDKSNLFGIRRCPNSKVCAVTSIENFISQSRRLQVDLTHGFLFRSTSRSGEVLNAPVSSEAMGNRLKTYLNELGINEGETAHSFRSGAAITLALTGSKLADVMTHIGWEREHTAQYYMQLAKVLGHDSPSRYLADAASDANSSSELTQMYKDINCLKDFAVAFPVIGSCERKSDDEDMQG